MRKGKHMYIPDLTPYVFMNHAPDPLLLAVGWLDEHHDFPKGQASKESLAKILDLCFKPVNQTRGFHFSPFLPTQNANAYQVEYQGHKMGLGSAEIRVPGRDGKCYAAPNLIYHYIKDCGYLPPQEFLEALEQSIT